MSKPEVFAGLELRLQAPSGFPVINPGDPLVPAILGALAIEKVDLADGDILVLAQKVVSKSEARYAELGSITPSERAVELAAQCGKDPRLVELILSESLEVLRCRPGVIIVRHRSGIVLANAGIDHSNIEQDAGNPRVLMLPCDADASAGKLRDALHAATGKTVGIVINDSLGRAWRQGTAGSCIGAAGLRVLHDRRGEIDLFGNKLSATVIGVGDEIAAAASLVMGQAEEGRPLVLLRGWAPAGDGSARDLLRPVSEDLFG